MYREFVDANDWLDELLPNARGADVDTIGGAADEPGGGPRGDHQRRGAAFIERLFGGRFGDALDRIGYETLLRYYALRLRARGVNPANSCAAITDAIASWLSVGATRRSFDRGLPRTCASFSATLRGRHGGASAPRWRS